MPGAELGCTKEVLETFLKFGYVSKADAIWDLCDDKSSTVNFLSFYFSTLNENAFLFAIFLVAFLLLSFYLLSSTAEDYLEPPLTVLAKKLKFSDSLAGVTLVALANGGNDVFAAFAASANEEEGLLLPVGSLFGAGCFVSTVVLAICLIFSKEGSIKLSRNALMRDCIFYFIGAFWILIQGFFGTLNYFSAIMLFVLYIAFIVLVVKQEFGFKRQESLRLEEEYLASQRRPSYHVSKSLTSEAEARQEIDDAFLLDSFLKHEHVVHNEDGKKEEINFALETSTARPTEPKGLRRLGSHSNAAKIKWQYFLLRHLAWNELKELQEKNLLGQICAILILPLNVARNFTIPLCTQERWNKKFAIAQPIFVALFYIWQFGYLSALTDKLYLGLFVLFVLSWSILIWKKTRTHQLPQGAAGFIQIILAFISAILWMNFVASILVDFMNLLSILSGLPYNYLGLTILAWGNSLNDLFVDSSLAKKGLGQVAVSGALAGQYFNFSLGFGASLIRQIIAYGPREFNLLSSDHVAIVNLLLIGCLLVSLLSTLIYGFYSKFELKRAYGIYLVGLYAICFISATLIIVVFPGSS